jgi:hypothetical protein
VLDGSQQLSFIDDVMLVRLTSGTPTIPSSPTSYPALVESCTCSAGYAGSSCEMCATGYTRPTGSDGDPTDTCITCRSACNGKSDTCDSKTGLCSACERFSTGAQCERCLPGYYLRNGECVSCPSQCGGLCEAASPQSVTWLNTNTDLADTLFPTGVKCTACAAGRTGDACEICADGFHGDPYQEGCSPCACNGVCVCVCVCAWFCGCVVVLPSFTTIRPLKNQCRKHQRVRSWQLRSLDRRVLALYGQHRGRPV